jgi:hypothetical protein
MKRQDVRLECLSLASRQGQGVELARQFEEYVFGLPVGGGHDGNTCPECQKRREANTAKVRRYRAKRKGS